MGVVAVIVGIVLVVAVLVDLINTLVATRSIRGRFWLTRVLYAQTWRVIRRLGPALPAAARDALYAVFPPVSVLLLLGAWVLQQVVGFGLIWWGIGGIDGIGGTELRDIPDAIYYSGVVYFTLGFGEIVPAGGVQRFGALVEAFSGVLTTALVIGYLPALYGAYSEREQKLLTLDDGSEERITPTNLVLSRCGDGDRYAMDSFFDEWEQWVALVLETHTTFPMLTLFRSQHPGQNWITALGLVTDAALHFHVIEGCHGRPPYWMLRRSIRLFQALTEGMDLSDHRRAHAEAATDVALFEELYATLESSGLPLRPYDDALEESRKLRALYGPELEFLIDLLDAPRGFWGHQIGHRLTRGHAHDRSIPAAGS